jgi:Tfp pilus assembly protein PilZ
MSIVQKLLANPSLRQQRFKRYGTDVLGRVEALLTRRSQDATMRNLSRGGAFLELNGPSRFRVGDLVRLHVQLRDLDRSYSLSGRLVWEASRTAAHDPAGFGMEFVHSQDMYGMLKDRL